MPEKIGEETDKKKEIEREAKKNRVRSRVIEKERQRETAAVHKAIVRTLFSHAHVESKARPISYGDSLTSRVHHRTCLYQRYWQPSFDEARRGGWLGSSTIQRTKCARVHVCGVCVCVRVLVSITSHLSPFVHPSVCLSVDRSVGSPLLPPSRVWKRERKREWERDVRVDSGSFVIRSHGRTRDWGSRSYLQDGRNFMSYNGQQRTHTRHGPNGESTSHEKPGSLRNECENRTTIFRF